MHDAAPTRDDRRAVGRELDVLGEVERRERLVEHEQTARELERRGRARRHDAQHQALFAELEAEGLIRTQKGRGSFLAERTPPERERNVESHLKRVMDGAILEARRFNLEADRIRKLFEVRLRRSERPGRKGEHDE